MTGLPWPLRVELWDAALAATRAVLRASGMREVSTMTRVREVALEPWIEPIAAGEGRWLATSPELAMKRLLARGGGPIFQISHVFRAAEIGAQHSEEFHLIEWYRTPGELPDVQGDVEAIVGGVFDAAAGVLGRHGLSAGLSGQLETLRPRRWRRVKVLDLMGETLGHQLAGNEPLGALKPLLSHVRARAGVGLDGRDDEGLRGEGRDAELDDFEAWTELFSLWSDLDLDPWLARQPAGDAIHVVDFPRPLAALAEVDDAHVAARFESHVAGVELANGYRELRDSAEQRRRFELVQRQRQRHDLAPLPMPEAFLAELDGLPPCAGTALGLDRLLACAAGCERLDALSLALPPRSS